MIGIAPASRREHRRHIGAREQGDDNDDAVVADLQVAYHQISLFKLHLVTSVVSK